MIRLSQKLIQALRSRYEEPRDRGAALVEAAIAIPILLLVILGSIEFGFAWEAKSSSTSGVRTGVLRAATIGDKPETDMRVLQSIVSEIGAGNVDQIDHVVIFEASAPDKEATIANCLAAGGDCVVYDTTFLTSMVNAPDAAAFQAAQFDAGGDNTTTYTCDPTKFDKNWCSAARTVGEVDAQVGIAIQYEHNWVTGIFPFNAPVFNDYTVTSTFQNQGANITPTVAVPSNIGLAYTSTFDLGTPLTNWSAVGNNPVATSQPGGAPGTSLLGRFGSDTVTLTVPTPQAATSQVEVCVSFTLWIIGSWDGANGGPDTFALDIGSDGVDEHPVTAYKSETQNTNFGYGSHSDVARPVTINECAMHQGDPLTIDFKGILDQQAGTPNDESWAIDDLNVTVRNP